MGSWVQFLQFSFRRIYLRQDQTSLKSVMAVSYARCRLDGMACGSVKTVSKNGKYRVPSMMANIFFSLVWGFCVCRRMQCGSFFSNWNISTIVLLILKYIRIVASATLFGLVEFGLLWSVVFYEGSSVVQWGGYTSGWGFLSFLLC